MIGVSILLDIALSAASHDLLLSPTNDLILIGNAERVAQQIKISLKTFLGEWFLDIGDGVPYFEEILVKNPNTMIIREIIRDRILTVPGVNTVITLDVEIDRSARMLQITHETQTTEGLVIETEVLEYGR